MEEENAKIEPSEPCEAQKAPDLGKFKSVDALVRAYGELEAEFTRRSQRLRALEEQSKAQPEPQGGQTDTPSAPEPARPERESAEELYRAVNENEGVRARVLSDYLESLKGVPLMTGSGTGVTAPAARPKTFAEAGKLAVGYLKTRK